MWRVLLGVLLLGGSPSLTSAQGATVLWQKFLGNRARIEEPVSQLLRTSHNRLVVTARVIDFQTPAIVKVPVLWIVTANGDSLTTVSYPQPPFYSASISAVAEAPNGDLLLYGARDYNPGVLSQSYSEMLLMRTDSPGNLRWTRSLNRDGAGARACLALPDGGAILAGNNFYPPAAAQGVRWPTVTRVDSLGRVRWVQHYGVAYDNLASIAALPDGSYALAGFQARVPAGQTQPDFDGWWLRLDARDGTVLRSRTFGLGPDNETFRSVAPTPDGGLLLAGSTFPNVYTAPPAVERGLLVQVDSLDREQWRQVVVAPAPLGQYGCAFSQVLPLPQPLSLPKSFAKRRPVGRRPGVALALRPARHRLRPGPGLRPAVRQPLAD